MGERAQRNQQCVKLNVSQKFKHQKAVKSTKGNHMCCVCAC